MRSSSAPSTARSPSRAMPSSRAMARPVSLWSPVTMIGRMPAARHSATATLTSSRGGSIWPISPSSVARPASASKPPAASSGSSATAGDGEHAQRPAGHAFGGVAGRVQRRLTIGRAQAQHGFRRALDEHAAWRRRAAVARRHHLGVGVERQLRLARRTAGRKAAHVDAGLAGGDEQRRLGRVAEHRPMRHVVLRRHEFGVVAQRDGAQQRRDGARRRASTGAPASLSAPCGA